MSRLKELTDFPGVHGQVEGINGFSVSSEKHRRRLMNEISQASKRQQLGSNTGPRDRESGVITVSSQHPIHNETSTFSYVSQETECRDCIYNYDSDICIVNILIRYPMHTDKLNKLTGET